MQLRRVFFFTIVFLIVVCALPETHASDVLKYPRWGLTFHSGGYWNYGYGLIFDFGVQVEHKSWLVSSAKLVIRGERGDLPPGTDAYCPDCILVDAGHDLSWGGMGWAFQVNAFPLSLFRPTLVRPLLGLRVQNIVYDGGPTSSALDCTYCSDAGQNFYSGVQGYLVLGIQRRSFQLMLDVWVFGDGYGEYSSYSYDPYGLGPEYHMENDNLESVS